MNRTLRRPMFRMGGSAEGITSGLDTPKRGVVDGPGKYSQDAADMATAEPNLDDVIRKAKSQSRRFAPRREKADINNFLISMGLDLVSRPRSGNIFQQVATSARRPFEQFVADKKSAARLQQDRESDLFGSFLQAGLADRKFDKKMAAEKLKDSQELLTLYDKTAEENVIVKAGDVYANLENYGPAQADEQGRTFEKLEVANKIEEKMSLIFELEAKPKEELTEEDQQEIDKAKGVLEYLYGNKNTDVFAKAVLKDTEYLSSLRSKIKKKLKTTDKFTPPLDETQELMLMQKIDEALQYYVENGSFPPDLQLAKGGRVGLQMGGQPMQAAMTTDQEQMPQIDFETLRARLPQEITDDIVRLIATSPQALEDFATIQTQQDVNNFNIKYNVELILPAEA